MLREGVPHATIANRQDTQKAAAPAVAGGPHRYTGAEPGIFEAIFRALDAETAALIGHAAPEPLVIPLRDNGGAVVGGFWGCTLFRWLSVQMLFVPAPLRGQRLGSALLAEAENEARSRACLDSRVEAFDFQASAFYEKSGYRRFGVLPDFPPGHAQVYLAKPLAVPTPSP